MTQELQYTSAPRGLKPGSQGFCTVVSTQGMSASLAQRVEDLSAYRHVFAPDDPNAKRNPVAFSHLRVGVGGKTISVLSRIGFAGLDYSQRANKFAHHVVLEPHEQPAGGPAWLLAQPGFMLAAWEGQVRVLPEGRTPPDGDCPPAVCRSWASLTGDAGWAGVLAETFLADPKRLVYLVFEPGMATLPLLVEALALLPPAKRWAVTFTTYFTSLPQGIPCTWRCVLRDSPEAQQALRLPQALIINLGDKSARAEGGALVEQARTGRLPARQTVAVAARASSSDDSTEVARLARAHHSHSGAEPPTAPQPRILVRMSRRRSPLALSILVASIALCATTGLLFFLSRRSPDASGASKASSADPSRKAAFETNKDATKADVASGHVIAESHAKPPHESVSPPKETLHEQNGASLAMITKEPIPSSDLETAPPRATPREPELIDRSISELVKKPLELTGAKNPKLTLVGLDDEAFKLWSISAKPEHDGSLAVKWDPMVELSDAVDLARFKVEKGKLVVDWKKLPVEASREVRSAQAVIRDCILEIEVRPGEVMRVLLRKKLAMDAIAVKGKEATLRWADAGGRPEREVFMSEPQLRLGGKVIPSSFLGDPKGKENEVFSFDVTEYGIKLDLTFHRPDPRGKQDTESASGESIITLAFDPNEKEVGQSLDNAEKKMTTLRAELESCRGELKTLQSIGGQQNKEQIDNLMRVIGNDDGLLLDLDRKKRQLLKQKKGLDQVTQNGVIEASISIKIGGKRVTVATIGKPK
ncbi:MAG TPA: hypothetical protein VGZ22_23655 [Isosphaeraceae bacterium]|nr:hypothetical protein [Isosphaeraceae bacterium]